MSRAHPGRRQKRRIFRKRMKQLGNRPEQIRFHALLQAALTRSDPELEAAIERGDLIPMNLGATLP